MLKLATNAWRDAAAAAARNPAVFGVAAAVVIGLGWVTARIHAPGPRVLAELAFGVVFDAAARTPCAIVVHRWVLLGPEGLQAPLTIPRLRRFFLSLLALSALVAAPGLMGGLVGILTAGSGVAGKAGVIAGLILGLVSLIAGVAALAVSVRFTLTFPAISVDRANAWQASWRISKGHWWRIVGCFVLALLPLVIAYFAVILPMGLKAVAHPAPDQALLIAVWNGLSSVIGIAVGAALASALFRTLGAAAPAPDLSAGLPAPA